MRPNSQAIKNLLNHTAETVESGALILAGTGLFGSLLGLLKNALLASHFGASRDLDIYFAAFRIPDFFYNVFIYGAVGAGFLPVLSRWLGEGKGKAWEFVSALMTFFVLLFGMVAVAIFIFARPVADFLVPGFSSQDAERVAYLLKILMLQPMLLAVSNIISGTLQTFRKFFVYSLAPVFYNIGIIIGIIWFARPWGIEGVAWGVVLGALFHILIQLHTFRALGFAFSLNIRASIRGLKEVLTLMAPRALTLAANQFNFVILTMIASLLPAGTLAVYNFSDSLQSVPQNLLVVSLATAAFPAFAESWAKSDTRSFRKLFAKTLSEIFIWTIPAAFILLAMREPLIRFTLAYGHFDRSAQLKTIVAFSIFIVALPIQGLRTLLLRAFFATNDTRTPLFSYGASTVVMLSSAYRLSQPWGAAGLAAGVVIGSAVDAAILFAVLLRRLKELYLRSILHVVWRSIVLGGITGGIGWLTFWATKFLFGDISFFAIFLRALVAVVPMSVVLFAGILMYKVFDFRILAFTATEEEQSHEAGIHP